MVDMSDMELEEYMVRSDRQRIALRESGVENISSHIRRRIESYQASADEMEKYYQLHKERFGSRSMAESEDPIRRYLAIESLREEILAAEGGL